VIAALICALYPAYEDPRGSQFVAEHIGVPAIMLPFELLLPALLRRRRA
jgi:hypothetical protein